MKSLSKAILLSVLSMCFTTLVVLNFEEAAVVIGVYAILAFLFWDSD